MKTAPLALTRSPLFRLRRSKGGIERLISTLLCCGKITQIRVFHRDGAKKNLIPHDNGASVCNSILEPGLRWTHVWDHLL